MVEQQFKADSLERALEQEHEASLTDHLTGLARRRGWEAALRIEESSCERLEGNAAVFVIELDELKMVNDPKGHGAGDALLVHAAEVLRHDVRAADMVTRLGGDEFGLLMADCDDAAAEAGASRPRDGFDDVGVAASFGFALRRRAGSLHFAYAEADRQMYRHKQARTHPGQDGLSGDRRWWQARNCPSASRPSQHRPLRRDYSGAVPLPPLSDCPWVRPWSCRCAGT